LGIPSRADPVMIWPPNVYLGKVVIVPNCELALSLPTEPKLARSFRKLI
jgi:hypothetical protein